MKYNSSSDTVSTVYNKKQKKIEQLTWNLAKPHFQQCFFVGTKYTNSKYKQFLL